MGQTITGVNNQFSSAGSLIDDDSYDLWAIHNSYYRRHSSTFGQIDPNGWRAWPYPKMMNGDPTNDWSEGGESYAWSPYNAREGNASIKFIKGQIKDASGAAVAGAVVQAYLTSTDLTIQNLMVATSMSDGTYEVGTPYAGSAHYLIAYLAGSPDTAGTTVNTLVPTNRDGT